MKTQTKKLLKSLEQKNVIKMLLPLNIQMFAGDQTLYELKQAMATIGQQLKKVEGELSAKAIDPSASIEDIQAQQKSKEDLQARFNVIKQQHDDLEAEQKAKFAQQQAIKQATIGKIDDPQQKVLSAKAELIRSTMMNKPISSEVRAALGDDSTGGGKFLPKTVSNEIIMEPLATNPLRGNSAVTHITNLEIPKLSYTLDDDDFIADKETAKELELTGDTVSFGRFKFKVFAGVSETVLNGTDTALVGHVENALKSGVAAKEKKVAFTKTPKTGEQHMSFYRTGPTAYADIQNTTVRRDNGKVHRQTDDGGRVSLEVTGNDSNNTMKFQVIHRNALGIATNTVTLPEPSNKYYTYIDTVRHGFVQVARQFDRVTEYDWTTGIAVRTIFVTTNFYNPSALIAIEPFMNSNDLKVIGNKGDISGSRYGIFNTSMVMEHSMTAYYAGGYGMTRLLQKNVWLITADTWSGIVNRENNAWLETWLNSNDGSAGTVLGFAELLTNIGRKI